MTTIPITTSKRVVRRCAIAVGITLMAFAIIALVPSLPLHLVAVVFLFAVAAATWWAGSLPALIPAMSGYLASWMLFQDTLLSNNSNQSFISYTFAAVSILLIGSLGPRVWKRDDSAAPRAVLASLRQGVITLDRAGRITYLNSAAANVLGLAEAEALGTDISSVIDMTPEAMLKLTGSAGVYEGKLELRQQSRDYQLSLLKDSRGKHLGFALVLYGRSSEEQETQALLAAIVADSDDVIISKSLDGIIRSWNASAERLFGYTAEEMIGRSINTIIPPELQQEEANILAKIRSGERLHHFQTVRVTKDHKRVELSLTVSPILDEQGRVIGASKVARDISAHKKAERALKASEERFRLMADSAPALIWMTNKSGHTTWFNRQWLEFTGRSLDEELDFGWSAGLHPDEQQLVLETYRQHYDKHEHYTIEHRLRRADGEYRWLLVNALPLQPDDAFSGYIGSCVDITDRKRAEESLRVEDRRKTEFIATLAHELRNPLAPIRNTLEIVKTTDYDPELWAKSHDIIERQLVHMVRLVDDLLNISRINQDKLALRTDRVELSQLIQQAVETVQSLADQCEHRLHIQQVPYPITLQADPVRLTQVLTNLLSNACKFTPPGGDITLSVRHQGDDVFISVKDTGIGVAPDELQSIFGLFQQSDSGKGRSTEGLGIGLTLARRLVEMHGGTLTASSPGIGQGTTFTISLPVVANPARLVDGPKENPPTMKRQRILVVDDNQDSAETLAVLLRLEEHEVHLAFDGLQAIEEAETFRPDVLLLDLGLPERDGIEVCRHIRAQPWGRGMTIIALTGWGQEDDRKKSADAGFDEHLVKPVSREALMQILSRYARNTSPAKAPV